MKLPASRRLEASPPSESEVARFSRIFRSMTVTTIVPDPAGAWIVVGGHALVRIQESPKRTFEPNTFSVAGSARFGDTNFAHAAVTERFRGETSLPLELTGP